MFCWFILLSSFFFWSTFNCTILSISILGDGDMDPLICFYIPLYIGISFLWGHWFSTLLPTHYIDLEKFQLLTTLLSLLAHIFLPIMHLNPKNMFFYVRNRAQNGSVMNSHCCVFKQWPTVRLLTNTCHAFCDLIFYLLQWRSWYERCKMAHSTDSHIFICTTYHLQLV
jgi:hypothetical protein